MDYFDKVAEIVQKLTDTLAQAQVVMKGLHERIKDIENRQDTMWKCLQGMTEYLKKEVKNGE